MSSPTSNPGARAQKTVHSAVVIDETVVVLDETFETPAARRSAIVDLLLANHDEVTPEDVVEILAPYGGADADSALVEVVNEYVQVGVDITVHLGTRQLDAGPASLFTVLTDYGDGTTTITHHPSHDGLLQELRTRAAEITGPDSEDQFAAADEKTCIAAIGRNLVQTGGRLYVMSANRQDEGETYTGHDVTS
ncbi:MULTISPECIES: hypothetical protein [unclassified Microbacterium]|uniref:hypothetical protein n=1 Tax=unclassified Microbacterium TaxID=2609290 RepID=UPI0028832684|nr:MULTISPECIES: hypothetical protein [unclassified Microbacterium]